MHFWREKFVQFSAFIMLVSPKLVLWDMLSMRMKRNSVTSQRYFCSSSLRAVTFSLQLLLLCFRNESHFTSILHQFQAVNVLLNILFLTLSKDIWRRNIFWELFVLQIYTFESMGKMRNLTSALCVHHSCMYFVYVIFSECVLCSVRNMQK